MIYPRLLGAFLTVQLVAADIYLHYPRGLNNRWCEQNANRNNANRMMDSENNDRGGYHCAGDPTMTEGDPLTFFTGSRLRIEWTSQHSCGQSNVNCQLVAQVACEEQLPNLRDPAAQGPIIDATLDDQVGQYYKREFMYNNEDGTNTIPLPDDINGATGVDLIPAEDDPAYAQAIKDFYSCNKSSTAGIAGCEYGLREGIEYYEECLARERMDVWASDENLNNRFTARFTRQNQNGNRHGLECPEERDYWPYDAPSPFVDLFVMTDDVSQCAYYQRHSQNNNARGKCNAVRENGRVPRTEEECNAISRGMWEIVPAHDQLPVDCRPHPMAADNHLGFTYQVDEDGEVDLASGPPRMAYYDWIIPQWMEGQKCTLRMRYNISTLDNMPHEYLNDEGTVTGSEQNCDPGTEDAGGQREGETKCECLNVIEEDCVPLYTDPYVQYLTGDGTHELAIALDGNQHGRTFQDQSEVFRVEAAPEEMAGDTIWNLNVRGKRGNIVEAYPSVETHLSGAILDSQELQQGDWIVFNTHNSWFNEENADGEGNDAMDGSNLCALDHPGKNFPMHSSRLEEESLWKGNLDVHTRMCNPPFNAPPQGDYAGCTGTSCCQTYIDAVVNGEMSDDDFEEHITNCGVINHQKPTDSVWFQVQADPGVEYSVVSTRNNNFSNRSQKGRIFVNSPLSAGAIAGIAIASVAVLGAGVGFGVYKFKTRAVSGNSAV